MDSRGRKIRDNNKGITVLVDGRVLRHKSITGVERYTVELLKRLAQHIEGLEILMPSSESRWLQHLWEHSRLPWRARRSRILFCPANMSPFWKPPGVRLITTIHDVSFLNYPDSFSHLYRLYYNALTPLVIKKSDLLITVSKTAKEELLRRYKINREKIEVIYSGVNNEFLNTNIDLTKGDYILYVGNLTKRKNIHGLLKAYLKIYKILQKKLVLVGIKPDIMRLDRSVVKILEKIPREYIEFKGQINDICILRELYRKATCFVFPSLYESFGFPVLEAMACGCPVIASNTSALPEICGDAAMYVDPLDTNKIAEAISRVSEDKKLQESLILKGRKRSELFSWDRTVKEHINIFRRFL